MTKCNCVEEVNAKLASRNTRLTQAMVLTGDRASNNPNLMLETEQIETGRGKPKAAAMFLSCCPFCGIRYEASDDPVEEEADTPLPDGLTATLEYDSLGLPEPRVFFDSEGQQLLFPRTEADLEGIHLNGGCDEITAERVSDWLLRDAEANDERLRRQGGLAYRIGALSVALRHVKEAIENADPDIITDTFWMPESVLMGATVVDFIGITLDNLGKTMPDVLPFDHVILEQADNTEGGTVTQTVKRPDGTEYHRIVDYAEAYADTLE